MEKIPHQDIVSILQAKLGTSLLSAIESYGMLIITVPKEQILETLSFLKLDPALNFHFLTDLTAVHYPFRVGEELEMNYQLHNMISNTRIRIKANLSSDNPTIDSIHHLYPAANWQERETYDFFGVEFNAHPDLRRIMNIDEMDYFPLLKQYPLEDATRKDKDDAMFGR